MGELKEVAIEFAKKAGFIYQAAQDISFPLCYSNYFADGGLIILSRFPIVEQDFHFFSLGIYDDAEVSRGSLYAKIEVKPGKCLQVFTLHTQCTNYRYKVEDVPNSRKIRDVAMKELAEFMGDKIDGQSTTILAGDFNIIKYPLNQVALGKIFAQNPFHVDNLACIESEYGCLMKTLTKNGLFNVIDCWDRDNKDDPSARQVTIGESKLDEKTGKRIAVETDLTEPID